jgi:penicillin-binding protein 2
VISILEEQARDYPGISYSVESVRRYQNDISAGTFIGYTGEVSPKELESEIYKDYRPGSLVGKKGVERTYDHRMRGLEGTRYVEVSARGQIIGKYRDKPEIPPRPGNDIVLTIDNDLQRFIVANFDSVKCCGAVVAMEPHNGAILALASFPEFDPNLFSGVIPPKVWDSINTDTTYPLFNRPLTGEYPPGSTTKLITAGAVLEEKLVTPTFLLESCRGGMQFGNRFFRCWDPAGHGRTNVYEAIEQSCDVYFYQVGKMLGIDTWADYARQCGFGKETGIDIPSEKKGVVADTEFFDKRDGKGKWSPNEALNLAIGQGAFSVTPLQLAQFYCGLANGGVVYRPHLIKEFLKADGSIEAFRPEVSFRLPFTKTTLEVLTQALDSVVQGDHGTARGQQNEFFRIAGKTGTAQNPHGDDHAWFACYAPCDNPRIVVVVLVENAGHGSEEAAPLAGKILKYYLQPKHPPLVLNPTGPGITGDSL